MNQCTDRRDEFSRSRFVQNSPDGAVTDEFADGLVNFGGLLPSGLSATVQENGSFSLDFTWTSPSSGMATADLDDSWSQSADTLDEYVEV